MSKLYVKQRYGTIPNDILNDPSLSLKAKGLWVYIQSKPDGWSFSIQKIQKQTKDGKLAVQSAIHELEQKGLLSRITVRKDDGKLDGIDYILHEKPPVGNQPVDNHSMENHVSISNKEYSKQDNSNKRESVRKRKKTSFSPPTQSDVIKYFLENNYPESLAIRAFKYYEDGEWKDSRGNPVRSWKQKMRGAWMKEENIKQTSNPNVAGVVYSDVTARNIEAMNSVELD